ncbi:hypothetical protein GYMLUDRAFT_888548 [Collybiopsis luxurians FD-317 M1]|uniref:Uncharacterized protein n=1 Tax=Collybiopsis luxurians FD-317 M1 TaxID=944289 RepID=A0A0D0CJ99_9AGAR|nr:hypothetical protein GYMLUDRAFT_888548 [Collybiopsis luxurians FD-317 M1]
MWHRPPRSFLYIFCAIVILSTFFLLFDSERRVTDRVPPCPDHRELLPPPPPPPPAAEVIQIKDGEPQFCNYCTSTDDICKRYNSLNLARSRSYEGPNARLKRVLRKARAGKRIKLGVLGGSVSKGHSVLHQHQWSYQYAKYLRETYNVEVELINGSVGATVSEYMETCFMEHTPEDVDIVIVELAINDRRYDSLAQSYENFLRALLVLPQKPAVINLQVMALMFDAITMGGDLHTPIAQYYDIPVISVRNVLLPHVLKSTEMDVTDTSMEDYWFHHSEAGTDLRHHGTNGHRILADLLKSFTSRVACEGWREEQAASKHDSNLVGFWDWTPKPDEGLVTIDDIAEYLPRQSLFQKYDHSTVLKPAKPFCEIAGGKRFPLNPLPAPLSTEGPDAFALWSHPSRPDKIWLTARKPGVKVAFKVKPSTLGRIRITYLRSKTYGLGSLFCWVDDNRAQGRRMDGWWEVEDMHSPNTRVIGGLVEPGEHILHCEILEETKDPGGGTEFRIISVDAL